MSVTLIVAIAWLAVIVLFLVFQVGRTRGHEEAKAEALAHFAPVLPALDFVSHLAQALTEQYRAELPPEAHQHVDALRKAASWN